MNRPYSTWAAMRRSFSPETRTKLHDALVGIPITHGLFVFGGKPTPTYRSWRNMKTRCTNRKQESFKHYGGRGIAVDRRWDSFENFLADMGERPEGTTLDRIDNDGDYEPDNCRWATPKEQRANQRKLPRKKRYKPRKKVDGMTPFVPIREESGGERVPIFTERVIFTAVVKIDQIRN